MGEPIIVRTDRFARAIERMPQMLEALLGAEKLRVKDRLRIPIEQAVVYLFSEGGRPIYVGQTRTPRRRYDQHTGPNRAHNEASFAFLKAKKSALVARVDVKRSREVLQIDPAFVLHFAGAKAWVAALDFQYIESGDVDMAGQTTTAPTEWALYVMEQTKFVAPLVQALEKARAKIKELEKRVGS